MNFAELLAHPGVEERCVLRSRFGFMAFHGGGLERMTDVIAREAAERAGASLYAVVHPDDWDQHLPSADFDPASSPALSDFVGHVQVVVTVHGYGRDGMFLTLLLGGQNRLLAEHVAGHLRNALGDFEACTDLARIPRELRGLHPGNPVNLPAGRGVQLELPPRVRGQGPFWAAWDGPGLVPHTESLVGALAAAARTWPLD